MTPGHSAPPAHQGWLHKPWLPRSLAGRVFAMFGLTMLIFLGAGLGMFYRFQFLQHMEETHDTASALVEVAAQTVEDSVVIGDYDTVKRTLTKVLVQSPFKGAAFIDMAGGAIRVDAPTAAAASAPAWLKQQIGGKLFDVNRVVSIGGRDYGVIRLSFDEQKIAARLWKMVLQAAALATVFFVLSLCLMRYLLKRWLQSLGQLRSDFAAGQINAEASLDAPSEIQEAIKAVNRTTASMRDQYGQRIDSLMNALVQHKSAMDQAAIVCEVDTDGKLIYVNDQFVQNSGFDRAELIGMELQRVGTPATEPCAPWAPPDTVWRGEVTVAGRHGERQWYRTLVPIFYTGRVVEKYICIDIDITKRKEFERTIIENARRQTLIAAFGRVALEADDLTDLFGHAAVTAAQCLGTAHAALFEFDGCGRQVTLHAGIGWPKRAAGSRFNFAAPPDTGALAEVLAARLAGEGARPVLGITGASIVCAERLFGAIGVYSEQPREFSADDAAFLARVANILAAALERHDAKKRLTYLAQYDPLTLLPNRRHLATCLEQAIEGAHRQGQAQRVSVMFIDLDRFKRVNDMLGHGVGDELLVQAGRRLQECVHPGAMVARLGGDEFAIVLSQDSSDSDTGASATRVVETLAQPFQLDGQRIFVSASVGIAVYPKDGLSAGLLLKSADTAMYSAKNNGRNNYRFYKAEMNADAAQRLRTENQLRVALERDQFVLHYQPKVDIFAQTIVGFEALLRWNHPERGQVPPLEFISILEDTGLIIPVGEWVIGQVCRQLKLWEQEDGIALPVAINLSARQFQQAGLSSAIATIVQAAGVDPRLLEFELTESMLMLDPESAVATLRSIKDQGMRLSVDDFGTGYSSLGYLKRFPLDALKIDRTFVRDLPDDADDAAITKAVISLAHSLNLKVVAEGVETLEQLRILQAYDCDEIQGYYFSKPLPADACRALLALESPRSAA
jgi:diguanylate cyclase (GGDEF)-like protein/PAS domain S-box-containing protein